MIWMTPVPIANPPKIDFQWVLRGSRVLRISSGSGREKKLRLWEDLRARAANWEGFFLVIRVEEDKREEVPLFVARRAAAEAENMMQREIGGGGGLCRRKKALGVCCYSCREWKACGIGIFRCVCVSTNGREQAIGWFLANE